MKKIELSQNQFALVSDEDYESLSKTKWSAYRIAGTGRNGKVHLYGYKAGYKSKGKKFWMHNIIMNPTEGMEVDHIDGDPLNNQRDNLRIVTHRENCMNRGKRSNGTTSKYIGVSWNKEKERFRALITVDGKSHYVGSYHTPEEAALAYNAKAIELFGNFARINKI
jgi:hypothetical protein